MAISTKGKRKIIVNNTLYYWMVNPDDDSTDILLKIIQPDDKKLFISYQLGRNVMHDRKHGFIQCPVWATETITPNIVRQIIEWYFSEKNNPIFVHWNGKVIPHLTLPNNNLFPIDQLIANIANFRVFYIKELQNYDISLRLSFNPLLLNNKPTTPTIIFEDIPLASVSLAKLSETQLNFTDKQILGTLEIADNSHSVQLQGLNFKAHNNAQIPMSITGVINWNKSDPLLGHFTSTAFNFDVSQCYFIKDLDSLGRKIEFIRE